MRVKNSEVGALLFALNNEEREGSLDSVDATARASRTTSARKADSRRRRVHKSNVGQAVVFVDYWGGRGRREEGARLFAEYGERRRCYRNHDVDFTRPSPISRPSVDGPINFSRR